jgi:hypothetical protein
VSTTISTALLKYRVPVLEKEPPGQVTEVGAVVHTVELGSVAPTLAALTTKGSVGVVRIPMRTLVPTATRYVEGILRTTVYPFKPAELVEGFNTGNVTTLLPEGLEDEPLAEISTPPLPLSTMVTFVP